MTLEMQVKKLLGINAVQNIMAKFQYYYTVSDYDAIGKLFYESDTTSAEVPGGVCRHPGDPHQGVWRIPGRTYAQA